MSYTKMESAIIGGAIGGITGTVAAFAAPDFVRPSRTAHNAISALPIISGIVGVILGYSMGTTPAPAPAPTPSIGPVTSLTLQAGHRYSIQQNAPVPGATITTVAQAQALFDGLEPGAVRVVSIGPASGVIGAPIIIILDAITDSPMTLPSTMPISDLGPTPSS